MDVKQKPLWLVQVQQTAHQFAFPLVVFGPNQVALFVQHKVQNCQIFTGGTLNELNSIFVEIYVQEIGTVLTPSDLEKESAHL